MSGVQSASSGNQMAISRAADSLLSEPWTLRWQGCPSRAPGRRGWCRAAVSRVGGTHEVAHASTTRCLGNRSHHVPEVMYSTTPG